MQLGGVDIIGILSLILGIIFYYKSKIEKRPTFVYQDTLLQSRNSDDITIYFRDEKIVSLRRLRVLFFNKGRKEIRAEDNPQNNFPTIELPKGTRIVASSILGISNPACGFQTKRRTDTSLEITFDYLNHDDGGVVEIMYDGGNIPKPMTEFRASIIGALSALSFKFVSDEQNIKIVSTTFMAAMHVFMGLIGAVIFIGASAKLRQEGFSGEVLGHFLLAIVIAFLATTGAWLNFILPFKKAIPKWAKPHFGEYK